MSDLCSSLRHRKLEEISSRRDEGYSAAQFLIRPYVCIYVYMCVRRPYLRVCMCVPL